MEDFAYAIMSEVAEGSEANITAQSFEVAESSLVHDTLSHYCDVNALQAILNKRTFRATRLDSQKLNDKYEAKRKDLEKICGSFFITCFTHHPCEIVPFWMNYGGSNLKKKVMLRFKNFASNFQDNIIPGYCTASNGLKVYLEGNEFYQAIKIQRSALQNGITYELFSDFDLRACIQRTSLCDIKYLPISDEVFSQRNKHNVSFVINKEGETLDLPTYFPDSLGKHKTEHWAHEDETRIIVQLFPYEQHYFDYIDIPFREEILRNLEIVLSPWCSKNEKRNIREIVSSASIDGNMKATIDIHDSELYDQINMKK